jgi:hypothetical protein
MGLLSRNLDGDPVLIGAEDVNVSGTNVQPELPAGSEIGRKGMVDDVLDLDLRRREGGAGDHDGAKEKEDAAHGRTS